LPFVVALLLVRPADRNGVLIWIGAAIVAAGELLRLWAVAHIGAISRTRGDRLGPLISSGPFRYVRNPLYIGNLLLWIGFTVSAQLLFLLPAIAVLLLVEYHAIVRWEETLLESRLGDAYRHYTDRVPRWLPFSRRSRGQIPLPPGSAGVFSFRNTLFSERGTLMAIGAGYLLLWLKTRLI
jgi:protein-S-isoprenylcysteine O-methyltransferase Ste14